jgi:hypothetical protein
MTDMSVCLAYAQYAPAIQPALRTSGRSGRTDLSGDRQQLGLKRISDVVPPELRRPTSSVLLVASKISNNWLT